MKCGRELYGKKAKELGVCPVAVHPYADGINEGTNGGRICWVIVGSYSLEKPKGSRTGQSCLCFDCDFHKKVLEEEGIVRPGTLTGKKKGRRREQKRSAK
ncbi:MAG TPA: hypothetical protein VEI28_00990 [Thermodesulfovibrionales bacterium]|nr:hypothetical protein [Thermodesulfovibrionales bacterium]